MAKRRLPGTLAEILKLTPAQFEEGVADLLQRLGYRSVQQVGRSGDLGVDITCQDKEGRSVVVQCKQYAGVRIGSKDIQTFIGMQRVHHEADRGMFVTTSEFTTPARNLAERHGITLIDDNELLNRIRQAYRGQEATAAADDAATDTRREIGVIIGGPAPFMQHHIRWYGLSKEVQRRNNAALACASRGSVDCLWAAHNESQRLGKSWERKKADLIWSEYEKIRHLDPVQSAYLGAKRTRSGLVMAEYALRRVWGDEKLEEWLKYQRILTRWSTLHRILRASHHQDSAVRVFEIQRGGQVMRASRTGGIREQFDGLIPDALINYALRPHDPQNMRMCRIPEAIFTKRKSQVKGWLQDTLDKLYSQWHIVLCVPTALTVNDAGEVAPEEVRVPRLEVRTEWTHSHEGVMSNTLLVHLVEAPAM